MQRIYGKPHLARLLTSISATHLTLHACESENLLVLSMCLRLQVYQLVKSISIRPLPLSISNKKTLPKQRFIFQSSGLIAFL